MGNGTFHYCKCYFNSYSEQGEVIPNELKTLNLDEIKIKNNINNNCLNNSINNIDNRENENNNGYLLNLSIEDYDLNYIDDSYYYLNNNDNNSNNNNSNISRILENIDNLAPEKKRCTICLEDFERFDKVINLSCLHMFHDNCIKTWIKKNKYCPICKNAI